MEMYIAFQNLIFSNIFDNKIGLIIKLICIIKYNNKIYYNYNNDIQICRIFWNNK